MEHQYTVILDDEKHEIGIKNTDSGYELNLGKRSHRFEILQQSSTLYTFLIDGSLVMEADLAFHQDRCDLYVKNVPYHLEIFDPRRRIISQSESSGGGLIVAPMPGKIVEVKVKTGDEVKKDQPLVVIEAMKMQNELNAPSPGVVKEVTVQAGDAVEADQKLVLVEVK